MGNISKNPSVTITYTVAECSEFHMLGAFKEGIVTPEEAVNVYLSIPPERMHGIPAIGINLHTEGTESYADIQADIYSGPDGQALEILEYMPEIRCNDVAMQFVTGLYAELKKKGLCDVVPEVD